MYYRKLKVFSKEMAEIISILAEHPSVDS